MRREAYVEDVVNELKRPVAQKDRQDSWAKLVQEREEIFPSSD
jgi:hypothetical protein